jgi:hypothetical protein
MARPVSCGAGSVVILTVMGRAAGMGFGERAVAHGELQPDTDPAALAALAALADDHHDAARTLRATRGGSSAHDLTVVDHATRSRDHLATVGG